MDFPKPLNTKIMKNILLLSTIIVLSINTLLGQKYITPSIYTYHKSDYSIVLQCYNMHVAQSDNPRLSLFNDTDTIDLTLNNINGSNITFNLIPDSLTYGFYSIIYIDNYNGSAFFPKLIFYTNSEYYVPESYGMMEPYIDLLPDSSQWVEISFSNSSNSSNIDSVIIIGKSEKIKADSIVILGNDYFKFQAPMTNISVGTYNLEVYRSDNILRYYPDYIEVKNPLETYFYPLLDSLLIGFTQHYFLKGKNTHFLSSKTSISSLDSYSGISIIDTIIHNDTTIECEIIFPGVKTIWYYGNIFKVYNDVDGLLKCHATFGEDESINDNKIGFSNLNIFPNPASDHLFLESPDFKMSENYKVEIFSTDGKRISKHEISGSNILRINNLNLASGSYFLRVSSENRTQAIPFIVE